METGALDAEAGGIIYIEKRIWSQDYSVDEQIKKSIISEMSTLTGIMNILRETEHRIMYN